MAETAISFGTAVWLAELKRDGWNITVSEQRRPVALTLQYVEDDFQPLDLLAPVMRVGVLATDDNGAGVFVPCRDKDEAWKLIERVDDEVAGVV